ncbi:G-protein coupled inwardly rectifying potassium channel-A [Trichostrongylus colubriformis]|uniref:G-protein coupled inwardly rectifying potassium channel-A n=1 Tax=Trichostrongylus colubriformis TaxID=6319 RepID=A0AAN8FLD8_TRICO
MESQHTIGYGFRYMTDNCPPAYIILLVQLVVGVFLQTMLTGIVLAKVLRPKKRKQEMRFSRMAVIGPLDEHDRRPALMIRLADIQEKLFLAESHVRLYMASSRINNRGDRELIGVKDMNVGYDSGWDRILLLWPIIIRHVIDESSPLHGITRESLHSAEFELIMTVEGIVEATGMTFQARTSFLPNEILWGHKFKPMVLMNEKLSKYEVHYGLFDHTERVLDFDLTQTETEELDDELAHHNNASGFM